MANETFALSEIEVDTLGLVDRGANREDFFLLKQATEELETEAEMPEVEKRITKSVWQKIAGLFKQAATEADEAEMAVEPGPKDEDEAVETEKFATEIQSASDVEPITEQVVDSVVEPVVESVVEVVATVKNENVDLVTEEVNKQNILEESHMAEDTISKADYEAIAKRLELAEVELAKAREDKERQVWLTKAAGFSYLPVAQGELANKLYALAKLDAGLSDWVCDVLKAVDNMVSDSGMFAEKGHNVPEVDTVTKALSAADPKQALLGLPVADAEAYLRAVRANSRK